MIEAVTDYTSLKNQLSHGNLVSVLADYSKKYVAFLIRYIRYLYMLQKQPPGGVLSKRCSENVQQIYRRAPMRKCDFNKVAKQLY